MTELPRTALTPARIAEAAGFFSYGANDPTRRGRGLSRDDAEARLEAGRAAPAPELDGGAALTGTDASHSR